MFLGAVTAAGYVYFGHVPALQSEVAHYKRLAHDSEVAAKRAEEELAELRSKHAISPPSGPTMVQQLDELEMWLKREQAVIDDKKRTLDKNEITAKSRLKGVEEKYAAIESGFREHYDIDRGIRTSDADRQRVAENKAEEVNYWTYYLDAVRKARIDLEGEQAELDSTYKEKRQQIISR